MNDLKAAAQQALEALEGWENHDRWVWPESALEQAKRNTTEALAALRTALAEPVQEPKPVAWMTVRLNVPIQTTARKDVADEWLKWGEVLPLYTAPPQRTAEPVQEPKPVAWMHVPYPGNGMSPLVSRSEQREPSMYAASVPLYLKEQL